MTHVPTDEQRASSPKICTELVLPQDATADAEATALDQRPDNQDVVALGGRGGTRIALPVRKLWKTGTRLRCRFLDGDPGVQQRVSAIAQEWMNYVNIGIDFGSDPAAEVRISFQYEGSWSTVGTDTLQVPADQPTMNYGWLTPATEQTEYRRVVLHEFGHALGAIHEHQSPGANIPWDKPKVYEYYMRTQGWTKQQVDHNLFERYAADSTNFTAFDLKSIMLYAIPDELTIGTFSTGWNVELSDLDRSFMALQYPKAAPAEVELKVDGPRVEASIGAAGETDTFVFSVDARGRHIITTEGPTDTLMSLFGPNDASAFVAADDDHGKGSNARIVRTLHPGTYRVRVKHHDGAGTGPYTVAVRTPQH